MNVDDKQVKEIDQKLGKIANRLGNVWLSFGKGVLSGFGYVLGAGLALILIGWFLNVIGVIPAFQETANEWRDIFTEAQDRTFVPAVVEPGQEIQN